MKIIIAVIASALVAAIAVIILVFVLQAHDLVLCGDIPQKSGSDMYVTRVYTYDIDATNTLSQIIDTMNSNTEGYISAEEMTVILSNYQNVVYAPVFTFSLSQEDENTFELKGSVFNGLDEDGEPADTDFVYKDLTLTVGVRDGKLLAAQNIYSDDGEDEDGVPQFRERKKVIDPVLTSNEQGAAFAFKDCDGFRVVFTGKEGIPATIDLAYTFNVGAQNLLNFSGSKGNVLGIVITVDYDDLGRLAPNIEMNRNVVEMETED